MDPVCAHRQSESFRTAALAACIGSALPTMIFDTRCEVKDDPDAPSARLGSESG